jgi:hypothetical protein
MATVSQPDGTSFQVVDDFNFNTVRDRILGHRDNRYRQQIEAGTHFIYRGEGVASLPGQPPNPFPYEIVDANDHAAMVNIPLRFQHFFLRR